MKIIKLFIDYKVFLYYTQCIKYVQLKEGKIMKKALILVDIQNDFCPGGALAVNNGDKIVNVVNSIIDKFDNVIATQDWHPLDHVSFASNNQDKKVGDLIDLNGISQVMWPNHCVQNSYGSEFVKELKTENLQNIQVLLDKNGREIQIDNDDIYGDDEDSKDMDVYIRKKGKGDDSSKRFKSRKASIRVR